MPDYERSKSYLDLLARLMAGYAWIAAASFLLVVMYHSDLRDWPTQAYRVILTLVCLGTSLGAIAAMVVVSNDFWQQNKHSTLGFLAGWLLSPLGLVIFVTPSLVFSTVQAFNAFAQLATQPL